MAVLLTAGCTSGRNGGTAGKPTVAIVQFVEHPVLDRVRQGFVDYLAQKNINVEISYHNAQGDMATSSMIAQQLASQGPDLVVAIATPAAQACCRAIKDRPVLFAAISDPVSAGLVASLEHPGGNATGTSDLPPVAEQVGLILKYQPHCRSIGAVYNPAESNSEIQIKTLQKTCSERQLDLKLASANSSSEVLQAAQSIAGDVDAMYMIGDNTVASAFASLLKACNDARKPLYGAESSFVSQGAVATVSIDYRKQGARTGALAERILAGADPADMPVETDDTQEVIVNREAMTRFGIKP